MSLSLPVVIASDQSAIPISGSISATFGTVATSTLTNVTVSTSNTTLVAANANRKALIIFNDASHSVFIKFGATASTSSFTFKLPDKETYEMPQPVYTGIIDAITSSGSGSVRVTELTT
jgi:hypothetical protein